MTPNTAKLTRRVGRFTSATLISRILGYARDALVAHIFGGEHVTDAFYTAFRTSNLFRRLLGEGAFTSSFVPVFSETLKTRTHDEVQDFLSSLYTCMLVILIAVTAAGIIFAPQIVRLIAPGFETVPEKFQLTVLLTRWMFPFFLFIALAALLSGVLNSLNHFFLSALAPASLSVAEILYMLIVVRHLQPDAQLLGLTVAVVAGGAAHFAVQLPQLKKEKFRLSWKWNWSHPGVKKVSVLMLPALIGLSADQINAFVDTICATFLVEGSVTALYNSNRLMQLPLALFGVSVAMVTLPAMSANSAERNYDELAGIVNSSMRIIFYTILPASLGLMILARPIVELLFQHGRFTPAAALLTARALQGYCAGLIAYSLTKVFANAFYSMQNPKIPVRVSISCVTINVVLCILLMRPFGVGGLAVATSIASWINDCTLLFILRKNVHAQNPQARRIGDISVLSGLGKTLTACAVMSLALFGLLYFGSDLGKTWLVVIGVPGGGLLFLAVSRLLRMEESDWLLQTFGPRENIDD